MTKKKKSSAADDLLDSLLEDVKLDTSTNQASDEQPEGLFPAGDPGVLAIGLPQDKMDSATSSEYESQDFFGADPQWENLKASGGAKANLKVPDLESSKLDIPSIHGHFQSPNEVFGPANASAEKNVNLDEILQKVNASGQVMGKTIPSKPISPKTPPPPPAQGGDETFALNQQAVPVPVKDFSQAVRGQDNERTVAVTAFAQKKKSLPDEKIYKGQQHNQQVFTAVDASLAQAESLKFAQQRILQLEREIDRYRQENDDLATAAEIIKFRADELENKLVNAEKEKNEIHDQAHSEILILKGNLQHRDTELGKAKIKIDELDTRLKSDFKKIRSKERELENRLELMRAEKQALIHAKDDNILDLQRRMDQMKAELDNYRVKVHELNKSAEAQNEQIRRTVRALRLALTNLETKDNNLVPLKKAE